MTAISQLQMSMQLQKEEKSNPKQPSCKKVYGLLWKRWEIQGGSQEMVGNFNNKNSDKFGAKSYSEMWRGEKATQELPLLT